MVTNNELKIFKSLNSKKFRQKYNKFMVEGHKSCVEFIKSDKYHINAVLATKKWLNENNQRLNQRDTLIYEVNEKIIGKVSSFKTPPEIILISEIPTFDHIPLKEGKYIFLDKIQDPGNLGTIIRIADWYGFEAVIASPDTVDFYNPKTIAASMGSMCGPLLLTATQNELIQDPRYHPLIATTLQGGLLINEIELPDNGTLVIGNEGHGINTVLIENAHIKVYLPGHQNKVAESLNAGVATAIFAALWH